MTEEFIKGLSTEQLLRHVVILIDGHISLGKAPHDKQAIDESRVLLMMFNKEIMARNSPTCRFDFEITGTKNLNPLPTPGKNIVLSVVC